MNHMYILSGMSFAGKSVLAHEISKAKHIKIIDPDDIAHEKGLELHSITVKCLNLRANLKVAISIAYYRGYTSIYGVEIMR